MVSKVAVMALVAVLAVPILLGYGMNLTETAVTEYKPDKETVNVSQLLQNSTAYTYIHADYHDINSDFNILDSSVLPIFNEISTVTSTFPMEYRRYNNQWWNGGARQNVNDDWTTFYEEFAYDFSLGHTNLTLHYVDSNNVDSVVGTVSNAHSIYYDGINQHYDAVSYGPSNTYYTSSGDTPISYFMIDQMSGTARATVHRYIQWPGETNFINISKGYYFNVDSTGDNAFSIELPEKSISALLTMNLDSITDNNFTMALRPGNTYIEKNTTGGVVSWDVRQGATRTPIYYDPSRSDNTYQIKFDFQFVKIAPDAGNNERKLYKTSIEYRYVGGWPAAMGEANYYQKYNFETTTSTPATNPNTYMDHIGLYYPGPLVTRTPTVRMDDAVFAAFEYPAIFSKEYDPASFKTNPSTMIDNITRYGDSIGFADQIYAVDSSGNITVGTRSISVNKMIMDSVPIPGGYENRINGYVISTSNDPSTITLYGTWVANITTDSQTANTYNTTVWNVGEFAWDGIDTNFLMVGLVTCLGVFVALGIYLRKTKSSMWPLLIVCGCAAGLFFCMI